MNENDLLDIHIPDSHGEDVFFRVHKDLLNDPGFDLERYKEHMLTKVEAARYRDQVK